MKHMKKLAGLLLALVMVLGMNVTAFATEPTYSITISNPADQDTYSAWKIFDVSYDGGGAYAYTIDKTVDTSNNATGWWAEVLKYMAITEGTTEPSTGKEPEADGSYKGNGLTLTPAPGTESTYVVRAATGNFSAPAFAEFLATKTEGKTYTDQKTAAKSGDTIPNVVLDLDYVEPEAGKEAKPYGPGYYLVTCKDKHDQGGKTALAELTTAAPKVEITDKNVPPAFEKEQQKDDGSWTQDGMDVQIGDTVNYKITSAVPDLTGYTKYDFIVTDILSEGLTLNYTSTDMEDKPTVTIKVGTGDNNTVYPPVDGKTSDWSVVPVYGYYTVENNVEKVVTEKDEKGTKTPYARGDKVTVNGEQITVQVVGFKASIDMVAKNYKDKQGQAIEITYSAVVNEKAVSGVETNEATLEYSNDPNDYTSTDTETDKTEVYDASIAVLKYNGATSDNGTNAKSGVEKVEYLSDAEFVLYRWAVETDGVLSFTTADTTDPTKQVPVTKKTAGAMKAYYKYTVAEAQDEKVEWIKATGTGNGVPTDATVMVTNTNGRLEPKEGSQAPYTGEDSNKTYSFGGLEAGAYYLLETAAPKGYNLLDHAVEVKVPGETGEGDSKVPVYAVTTPVANSAGTMLPSTGGVGTTIFYILGGVLVLGAAVLLIVRRRMRAEK